MNIFFYLRNTVIVNIKSHNYNVTKQIIQYKMHIYNLINEVLRKEAEEQKHLLLKLIIVVFLFLSIFVQSHSIFKNLIIFFM